MEVSKEELKGNKVALDVEVEEERVDEVLNQAYKKVVKDVSIPGFRKGKVPRKILEKRFGEEVLHRDAFDLLIPRAYSEAVKAARIEPVDQPEIDDFYIAAGEPATFRAVVEVKPEVELGQYTDLGIEKEEVEVTEEEVEGRLEKQVEQHSQLVNSDKEVAETGDHAIIDFTGYLNGEEFEGGSAEEYTLELGSGNFIPGFEDQLIGAKVGEDVEVDVTFPEDYQSEDLAGQDVIFKVEIKEIKEKQKPELNDDFAKEVSEYETLAELKESIKEEIREQKEKTNKNKFEEELLNKIAENSEVDISDTLVDQELDQMYQNMEHTLSHQGMKIEDYLNYMGLDEAGWREENKEDATKRAKQMLILDAIAEAEGIEAPEEEVDAKIAEIAEQHEQDVEQVKAIFKMQGQLDSLIESIKNEKTFDFLVENN